MRTPRQGHLGGWTTVLAGLLLCLPIADALGAFQPVRPILECVTQEGPSQYTAVYGYKNENAIPITIPVGSSNKFTPTPQDRGQTTVFQPGRTPYDQGAFRVPFPGSNLVWTLKGPDGGTRTSTASANSKRCPGPTLTGLDPASLSLTQGGSGVLTATISAVQASATTITLTSSDPTVVSVPASVSIPAGAVAVPVPVAAIAPGAATITAALNGSSRQSTMTVLPAGPTLTSLLPATLQVTQGANGTFTVTISAAQGTDTIVSLSSTDAGIVTVPATVTVPAGAVTVPVAVAGLAPGTATVTAGPLNGTSVQSQVTVVPPLPTVVSLAPPVLPLTEGSSGTLTVTLNASQPTDTEVALITSDPAVVGLPSGTTVTIPAGTVAVPVPVVGLSPGAATVTASLNGTTATSAVTVQPPLPTVSAFTCPATLTVGATGQCTVTLNATQLADTVVSLAAIPPGVLGLPSAVTIPAGSRSVPVPVSALTVGSAVLTAGPLNATTKQATVQVQPLPPTLVGLAPSPATLLVGSSTTLTLTVTAAPVTDTAVALAVSPTGVLTVPTTITVPAGQVSVPVPVTGLTPGATVLTAGPLNGTTADVAVSVNQLPPAVTGLTPPDLTLPKGTADSLTVTIAPVQPDPTAVPLTSSDPAAVEVPASVPVPAGSATAAFPVIGRNVGPATVTAGPLGGTTAQATVTVTPPALVTLGLAPAAVSLAAGQTQAFVATGTYTDGTTQDLASTATWTSSNDAVATVTNPGGVVTARAVGQATITVTAEGKTATATISVTPPILTVLALTPTLPTRAVGQAVQFQVTGTYTDGTTQDLTGAVAWTSSNPGVAPITSPGGLAAALAVGPTTIIATHAAGMSASTTLTVTPPVAKSLALHPTNTMLVVGQTLQLTVLATLTDGTIQDVTATVAWSSGAPLVVSVSGAGLLAGLTPGTTTVTATHPAGPTASTTVTALRPLPALTVLDPAVLAITSEYAGTLTVTIDAPQPTGTTVTLESSDAAVATVPASVAIPAGALNATIPVTGRIPGTATITATIYMSRIQSTVAVSLPGAPPASLSPIVLAVAPGAASTLTVRLSAVATTETRIALTSSNPAVLEVRTGDVPTTLLQSRNQTLASPASTGLLGGPPGNLLIIPAGQRSQSFTVTGVAPGQATVTASLSENRVQGEVIVTTAPPTVVGLDPPILSLLEATDGQFTVTLSPVQSTDTEVFLVTSDDWAVSLPADRVTVPANLPSVTVPITANFPGAETVTASLNGRSATAAVWMAPWYYLPTLQTLTCPATLTVGATGQCRLTLHRPQSGETEVALAASVAGVLAVPTSVRFAANMVETTFEVTGVAPGASEIAGGPLTGTSQRATVQVVSAEPTLVSLLPSPASLAVGVTTTLNVSLDAIQSADTTVALASTPGGIIRVPLTVTVPAGSLGTLVPMTGLALGTATVTAGPVNGTQRQAEITVTQLPPTIAAVTPSDLTAFWYRAAPFKVTLSAAQAEPVTIPLTSSDPNIVQVPPTLAVPAGAIRGLVPIVTRESGTATITVGPVNGSSSQSSVTVNTVETVALTVLPPAVTLALGQTRQFAAIGSNSDGSIEDDTYFVTWRSGNADVTGIDNWDDPAPGVAKARSVGTATITATLWDEQTATATLTVTPSAVIGLTLTPLVPTQAVGETVQFRATGTFTDGRTEDLTEAVTWTSNNPTVATIASPGGLAVAMTAGTSVIAATYPAGPTASTTLTVATVLPPRIDSLTPNRGQVGMRVSVFGARLAETTQVTFNGVAAAVTVQSSTQLTVTVPAGATTGPLVVTSPHGTGAAPGGFTVTPPPTIAITSPADGASLTAATVVVQGTVSSSLGEAGVTVNGLPVQGGGGQWLVAVPVGLGTNVITARATDVGGAQATTSITVTVTTTELLVLRALPASGIAPLTVAWQVVNQTGRRFYQYQVDPTGAGRFNPPVLTLDGVRTTYPTPGLFHPVVRAYADDGTLYTATTIVSVLSRNPLDAVLRVTWNGMKAALQANAIETAVSSFTPSQQARYRTLFTALAGQLSRIATDMEEIELVQVIGRQAQYRLQRTEEVGGKLERVSYYIYFVQGQDGVWRIREF